MKNTRTIIYAGIFAALIAVGGRLGFNIPVLNSSFTLQVLMIYLCAFVLPPLPAFSSVLVYIVLGLIGLPIFANGGGLQYIFHPTFGFLLGFLGSAPIMSYLLRKGLNNKGSYLTTYIRSMLAGLFIMYIIGLPYMFAVLKWNMGLSEPLSVVIGVLVFIPLDILKAIIAYPIARALKKANLCIGYN